MGSMKTRLSNDALLANHRVSTRRFGVPMDREDVAELNDRLALIHAAGRRAELAASTLRLY